MRRTVFLLVFLVLFAAAPALADGRFLALSDVHFDPMADPALVDRLNSAAPEAWAQIFATAADKSLGRAGRDTDWPLLSSALAAMKEALPHPDFVVMAGDFLAHNFRAHFDATATNHTDAAYRAFVARTMRFLALELQRTFPNTPILPVLGNNDSYCGDYRVTPGGGFLKDMLPTMRGLLRGAAGADFARDWPSLGNYSARLPPLPHVRIVALGDVFFSPHYSAACGGMTAGDPGKRTLAWLADTLAAARRAQEHVWLVYHIPPGIDDYATARFGACPQRIVPLWKPAYASEFAALLKKYADTITANLAGHLHIDTLRLDDRTAFILTIPAVSPIFGQNPAFKTLSYDAAERLADATTYELPSLSGGAAWVPEYRFTSEWRLPHLDLAGLDQLYHKIGGEPQTRARWLSLYAVSNSSFWPSEAAEKGKRTRAAYCAAGHLSAAGFAACYCVGK
jgi:sphingomyelin phosphodiesterase acid-like 3